MIRIFSVSLGCPKNRVDTERVLGLLSEPPGREADGSPQKESASEGLVPVETPEKADVVFINTCAFIAPAVQESVRTILETGERLRVMPKNKRPLFVVAGCLVGRYGKEELAPELPEVDVLLDNRELDSWGETLCGALGLPVPQDPRRLLSTGPSYTWLKISDGCRHACSFCTIPSIRGPLRSAPAESILREARALLEQGVKELVLVAQDLTAWGRDKKDGENLVSLLKRLLPLPGLARLRLLYLYPAGVTGELLHFLRDAGPPFVPYFDVPMQHASAGVLSRMGRPFAQNPMAAVERIRAVFPEAALRTSIITGFPGETEENFALLCRFVSEARFHHLGVFAYEAEEGTAAAGMPGQVPRKERTRRRDTLMRLQKDISGEILEQYVGERLEVLVDSENPEWPGLHTGRVWFQAPEIDGVTHVSGPGVMPGALVSADIVESSEYDLVALTDAEEEE